MSTKDVQSDLLTNPWSFSRTSRTSSTLGEFRSPTGAPSAAPVNDLLVTPAGNGVVTRPLIVLFVLAATIFFDGP
eukprot:2122675-Pleurochrysis_carterae.AAC.1